MQARPRADRSTGGPRAARSGGGRAAAEGRGAADDADALALALDTLDTLDAAAAPPTAMRVRGGGCVVSKARVEQEAAASGTPGPGSPPAKQAQQGAQGEVAAAPDAAAAAREATRAAIKARVAHVAALPEAERAAIGAQYTDPEGLWAAIGGIVIISGKWLKEQSSESGFRLPKRGSELPAEAIITVDELRAIHKASTCEYGALPVVAVSQCAHSARTLEQRPTARARTRDRRTRVHNALITRVRSLESQLLAHKGAPGPQRGDARPHRRRAQKDVARV